jgi:hypothetical protein
VSRNQICISTFELEPFDDTREENSARIVLQSSFKQRERERERIEGKKLLIQIRRN